ncbi:MAG: TIGR03936 family radical SAM-associated protein [Caldilineaceae bacterium]|nr:TIGR03936 family radical SAM-associated protein [Caldilineaceae bacterium]
MSNPNEPLPRQRVRLTYEKGEAIKFIGHQDEFRLWERTLRRADLPLLYKQGFNPQPHIQFAAPLGLGMTGRAEQIDVTFSPPVPLDELAGRIREKLPPGALLHGLAEVELKTKALQGLTIGADYTILLFAEPGEIPDGLIQSRIDAFWAKSEAWRQRERGGEAYRYNLRPLIFVLRYEGYDPAAEEHRIFLRVQQRPGATGRPDEVVDVLGLDDFARTLRRERIYFEDRAEDVALMAAYPLISQAEVADPDPPPKVRRRKGRGRKPHKQSGEAPGRKSFADKAADEFV